MESANRILELIASAVEMISAGILLTGFAKVLIRFLKTEWNIQRRRAGLETMTGLRRQLGIYVLLGLDFYIVSDILHSMIRPELNELLSLAVIVLLRTTIGFFLGKEVSEIEKQTENQTLVK